MKKILFQILGLILEVRLIFECDLYSNKYGSSPQKIEKRCCPEGRLLRGTTSPVATVSCRSWRAADCSQNNRVPVDRYVTPIYVDQKNTLSGNFQKSGINTYT